MKKLTFLNLSMRTEKFSKHEFKVLSTGFAEFSCLTNLRLEIWNYLGPQSNDFGDQGLIDFSEAISSLKNLKICELLFHRHKFTNLGALALSKSISHMNLEKINLSLFDNEIEDEGMTELLSTLINIGYFMVIFGRNKISDIGARYVIGTWEKLKNVKKNFIDLSENNINPLLTNEIRNKFKHYEVKIK